MARRSGKASRRSRVGKVSYYFRNGSWHVYYREAGKQSRPAARAGGEGAPQWTSMGRHITSLFRYAFGGRNTDDENLQIVHRTSS